MSALDIQIEECERCPNFKGHDRKSVSCGKRKDRIAFEGGRCPLGRWADAYDPPSESRIVKEIKPEPQNPKPKREVDNKKLSPMLMDADKKPVHMADMFNGRSLFMVMSGPSFKELDAALLDLPGIVTMGVNNSPKVYRPTMWASVDHPQSWIRSIWLDPRIMKFCCIRHRDKYIFDSDKWDVMDTQVRDCPNVIYYERNADPFDESKFLTASTFWWGQSGDFTDNDGNKGGRSVMLLAIRLAYYLGFRRVFLLGCDFTMDETKKYSFEQDRHKGSIRGNNATYKKMNHWFGKLRPIFEANDFYVFNCNAESKLDAFDYIPYTDAIELASGEMGKIDFASERTKGLYERDPKNRPPKKSGGQKVAEGKSRFTSIQSAKAKVRSPHTGKVYRAKATAEVTAEATAKATAKTEIGSRARAEGLAIYKARRQAERDAARQAKEQAQKEAERMMREAEPEYFDEKGLVALQHG